MSRIFLGQWNTIVSYTSPISQFEAMQALIEEQPPPFLFWALLGCKDNEVFLFDQESHYFELVTSPQKSEPRCAS